MRLVRFFQVMPSVAYRLLTKRILPLFGLSGGVKKVSSQLILLRSPVLPISTLPRSRDYQQEKRGLALALVRGILLERKTFIQSVLGLFGLSSVRKSSDIDTSKAEIYASKEVWSELRKVYDQEQRKLRNPKKAGSS